MTGRACLPFLYLGQSACLPECPSWVREAARAGQAVPGAASGSSWVIATRCLVLAPAIFPPGNPSYNPETAEPMAQTQTRLLCIFSPQEHVHFSKTVYFYFALLISTPARSSCTTSSRGPWAVSP